MYMLILIFVSGVILKLSEIENRIDQHILQFYIKWCYIRFYLFKYVPRSSFCILYSYFVISWFYKLVSFTPYYKVTS